MPKPTPRRRITVDKRVCYFAGCTAIATSDDHVPPKVFFPEGKDVDGDDYRINLLTVRSCDAHNNEYSDDEDFIAYMLLGKRENNEIALTQWEQKVMRALDKKGNLASKFIAAIPGIRFGGHHLPLLRFPLVTLERVMRKITRGLHYGLTGERLDAFITVEPLLHAGGDLVGRQRAATLTASVARIEPNDWKSIGHPHIFEYVHKPNVRDGAAVVFAFRFYGGTEIVVLAQRRLQPFAGYIFPVALIDPKGRTVPVRWELPPGAAVIVVHIEYAALFGRQPWLTVVPDWPTARTSRQP